MPADAVTHIADFLCGFSVEATRPKATDLAELAQTLTPGTQIYLSAIPTRPSGELAEQAAAVHEAGLEPVPHIAVRNFKSKQELDELLSRLQAEAACRRVLIIAGDRSDVAGPFSSSIEVVESGLLQRHGIAEIGIAGHPEGHPRVASDVLDRALQAKIDATEQSGLKLHIVTQFGFDAPVIIRWVKRLREFGCEQPVRIGLAGPTNLATLLRYAQRCGVKASAAGVTRSAGLVKHLFGTTSPDALVRALTNEAEGGTLGDVAAHFFSFGGIGATARWAAHAEQGRIALDGETGFSVEG